jgi:hypothetical protein
VVAVPEFRVLTQAAPRHDVDFVALLRPPEWYAWAACRNRGVDPFFPTVGQSLAEARTFCRQCAVRLQCFDYAVATEADGVWAGTTGRQRARARQSGRAALDRLLDWD